MKSKYGQASLLTLDTILIAVPILMGSALAAGLVAAHFSVRYGMEKVKDMACLKK
jgi:hypothetical protein